MMSEWLSAGEEKMFAALLRAGSCANEGCKNMVLSLQREIRVLRRAVDTLDAANPEITKEEAIAEARAADRGNYFERRKEKTGKAEIPGC